MYASLQKPISASHWPNPVRNTPPVSDCLDSSPPPVGVPYRSENQTSVPKQAVLKTVSARQSVQAA